MFAYWICSYEKERRLRVAIIHGLARMAAIMATIYTPHLGVGLRPLAVCHKHNGFIWLNT
jgi:zeaxanthin epoxidase